MPPWARRSAPRRGMQSAVDRCIAVGSLVHGSDDQAQNHAIAAVPRLSGATASSRTVEPLRSRVPGHGRGRSGIRRRAADAPGAAKRQVLPQSGSPRDPSAGRNGVVEFGPRRLGHFALDEFKGAAGPCRPAPPASLPSPPPCRQIDFRRHDAGWYACGSVGHPSALAFHHGIICRPRRLPYENC
jgi:hypothetical protein